MWKSQKEKLGYMSGESKEAMDNYEIWKSNIFYEDEEIIGLIALLNKYIENPDACNRTAASRIGSRIRFIRTTKGLSQAELGEKVELSSDRIQKYENGARKPKLSLLKRIADALNVSILALIDPSITTYENIMYALFELVNQYGVKLEKGNHKMCLTVDFGEVLYDYLMEWYEQYLITIEEVKAANSGEEKRKILTSYYNWEWNYPDGIDKEINKRIQRSRIKKVIEKLENELKELDGSEEENDS